MRKKWLAAVSTVLLFSLMLSVCCPFGVALAEEVTAETEVQETAAPQKEKQIFLVPAVDRDYGKKDTDRRFELVFKDVMQLLPADSTAQTVLFPVSGEEAAVFEDPAQVLTALELPYEIKKTAACLSAVEQTYAAQAKKNILIALESRNYQRTETIEEYWGALKQLAANGVEVYLIGLETKKNEKTGPALAGWLSDGRLTEEDENYVDQMIEVADHLHYAWITDYDHCLNTLMPLAQELSGLTFQAAQQDENGMYTLYPYAELTEQSILLLEGKMEDAVLSITDGQTSAVEHEVVRADAAAAVIRIENDLDRMEVAAVTETSGLLWAPVYRDLSGLKLVFANRDGKTTFERNEEASFYAVVPDVDQDRLAQGMSWNGVSCEMLDASTGEVLQTMVYDADARHFRADYVFTSSSEERQLAARIKLNETVTLTSAACTVAITNTVPEISSQAEDVYWIGDPWEENQKEFSIPLETQDHESDAVTLDIVEPQGAFLPGLGHLKFSEDQSELQIDLIDQPKTAEAFTIKIAASDGELTTEPHEISFILYGLSEELGKLKEAGRLTVTPDATIAKYADFGVSAKIVFPEDLPDVLKEKLNEKIQEHYSCTLNIVTADDQTIPVEMTKQDDWVCSTSIDQSGTYTLQALFSTDNDELNIASEPVKITVEGKVPVKASEDFPAVMDEMMSRSEESAEEFWAMEGLIPSKLFTDGDGDEITMTVTAKRIDQKEEDQPPTTLQAVVSGDEAAELRFTVSGKYEVTIASADEDGSGEKITCTVFVTSARDRILQYALLGAAVVTAAVLLIWLVVYLAKPSFKGKVIETTITSARWTKTTVVYTDVWKKKKQPASVLLTCAACPPDGMLYAALESCTIQPRRQGIALLKAENLGLEKNARINTNESLTFTVAQYTLTLKVVEE